MRPRRARRSLAYEACNRPWRLVSILRAVRLGLILRRDKELELAAWAETLNRERRRDHKRQMLRAMYRGTGEHLTPWQEELLLDLATGEKVIDPYAGYAHRRGTGPIVQAQR